MVSVVKKKKRLTNNLKTGAWNESTFWLNLSYLSSMFTQSLSNFSSYQEPFLVIFLRMMVPVAPTSKISSHKPTKLNNWVSNIPHKRLQQQQLGDLRPYLADVMDGFHGGQSLKSLNSLVICYYLIFFMSHNFEQSQCSLTPVLPFLIHFCCTD